MEGIPSFIKIGGAVSEKNGNTRHTFVVLYIGYTICLLISPYFDDHLRSSTHFVYSYNNNQTHIKCFIYYLRITFITNSGWQILWL